MIKKLLACLTPHGKKSAFWVLVVLVFTAILEVTGIASVLPFMMLVSKPSLVTSSHLLQGIYQATGFERERDFVILTGVLVLLILAGSNVLAIYSLTLSTRMAGTETAALAKILLRRYLGHEYLWFLSQNSNILGRNVLVEIGSIPMGILLPLLRLIARAFAAILIMLGLLIVNPVIAVATGVFLGGAYSIAWLYTRERISLLGGRRLALEGLRTRLAMESLSGIKTNMVLNREASFLEGFGQVSQQVSEIQTSQVLLYEGPRFLMETLAFGGVISTLLYFVINGKELSSALPILSIFTLGAYRLIPALQLIFSSLGSIKAQTPVLNFFYGELRRTDLAEREIAKEAERLPFRSEVRLENLTFTYPGKDQPVLKDLSLTVKRNTCIALVGHTGSGKTTLADIFLGLLEPQQGRLRVDDTTLSKENIRSWQRNIGYVSQDIYLADDTIRANVAIGIPTEQINQQWVEEACRLANLHDFISHSLNQGYDTMVGERGIRMSGGQRQRIGIARALYHKPEVLVLDEATSSLDGITENAVMEAVHTLSESMTIVMIAHRLTTVQDCDVIYFLKDGQLADRGSYQELLEKNEEFRAMARQTTASGVTE